MDGSAVAVALSTLNVSSIEGRWLPALSMQYGVDRIAGSACDLLLDLAFRDGSSAGCLRSLSPGATPTPVKHRVQR